MRCCCVTVQAWCSLHLCPQKLKWSSMEFYQLTRWETMSLLSLLYLFHLPAMHVTQSHFFLLKYDKHLISYPFAYCVFCVVCVCVLIYLLLDLPACPFYLKFLIISGSQIPLCLLITYFKPVNISIRPIQGKVKVVVVLWRRCKQSQSIWPFWGSVK